MLPVRPLSKLLLLISLSLSVAGCSTFSFFFERLPWLSSWQMSRMFDLNDEQETKVEDVAEQMKAWFKKEGFPGLLADLEPELEQWRIAPSPEQINGLFNVLEHHNSRFLSELAPKLAPVVMTLSEENLSAFDAYLDEKTEDWFESLESAEDKQDSRVDRLENWFGDLSDAQVAIVRKHVVLFPNERDHRLQNTKHWEQLFAESVREGRLLDIENWIREPSVWWTDEYTQLRSENRKQISLILVELVPTLSERQADRAAEELSEWIEELKDVIGD